MIHPLHARPMPWESSLSTASGVEPSTPSTQSSSMTTHSLSYDRGSLGSSTISGAYRPRSCCTPTCGWNQYVPVCRTAKRYANSAPALTPGCVRPGTPSMSLRTWRPCQCRVVGVGRWLARVTARVSPAVIRISLPGSRSPYAQEGTVRPPPRSRRAEVAVRWNFRTGPEPRLASTAATSSPLGETYSPWLFTGDDGFRVMSSWFMPPGFATGLSTSLPLEQAARTPVPARAIPAPSTARRVC